MPEKPTIEEIKRRNVELIIKEGGAGFRPAAEEILDILFKNSVEKDGGWVIAPPDVAAQRKIIEALLSVRREPEQVLSLVHRFFRTPIGKFLDGVINQAGIKEGSPVQHEPEILDVMSTVRMRWLILQTMNVFDVDKERARMISLGAPKTINAVMEAKGFTSTFTYITTLLYDGNSTAGYRQRTFHDFRPNPADADAVERGLGNAEELSLFRARCAQCGFSAAKNTLPSFPQRKGTTSGAEALNVEDCADVRAFLHYLTLVVADLATKMEILVHQNKKTSDAVGSVATQTTHLIGYSIAEGLLVEFLQKRFPEFLRIRKQRNKTDNDAVIESKKAVFLSLSAVINDVIASLTKTNPAAQLSGNHVMLAGKHILREMIQSLGCVSNLHTLAQYLNLPLLQKERESQELPRRPMPPTVITRVLPRSEKIGGGFETSTTHCNTEEIVVGRGMHSVNSYFVPSNPESMHNIANMAVYRTNAGSGPSLTRMSCIPLEDMLPPRSAALSLAKQYAGMMMGDALDILKLARMGDFEDRLQDIAIAFLGTKKKLRYMVSYAEAEQEHLVAQFAQLVLSKEETVLLPHLPWDKMSDDHRKFCDVLHMELPADPMIATWDFRDDDEDEVIEPEPPQDTRIKDPTRELVS